MYRCPESSECRDPTVVEGMATVTSLSYLVRKTMEKAKGNIEGRKKQSFTDLDKTIYLNSATPVWRLVNVAAMNKKTVDLITNNYSEIIATELAYAWFGEIARTLQKALSNYSIGKSPDAVTAGQNLTDSLAAVEAVAINEYGSKLSHATAMMTAQRNIQWLHETMMNAMSPELSKSLVTFNQ